MEIAVDLDNANRNCLVKVITVLTCVLIPKYGTLPDFLVYTVL